METDPSGERPCNPQETERRAPRRSRVNSVRPVHLLAAGAVVILLGVSYWLANSPRGRTAVQHVSSAPVPGPSSPKVEVVNASGTSGLAMRATEALRSRGFDVVDFSSDRSRILDRTIVVDRSGNPGIARQVADALGLPKDRVQQRVDRQLLLDATVLLGRDAQTLSTIRSTTGKGTD